MIRLAKLRDKEPVITYEQFDLSVEQEASFDLAPLPGEDFAALLPAPPAPPAHLPVPAAMTIAAGSEVEGKVRSCGAIRVVGTLRGELEAESLYLAREGVIEGKVTARTAFVEGTLRGSLAAREIEILGSAVVEAELTYEDISIARGARVSGLHRRHEPAAEVVAKLALAAETGKEAGAEAEAGATEVVPLGAAAEAEKALQDLAAVAHAAAAAATDLANGSVVSLAELEAELRAVGARIEAGNAAA